MPALFDQGFFVREPAWHGMGVVLDDYPDRDTAMELAGHNWDVILRPIVLVGKTRDESYTGPTIQHDGEQHSFKAAEGWQGHIRSDNGELLHVARESFERIPNSTGYDIAEMLFEQGFQYETGITLDGGKTCAITLKLDEPIRISGDDSIVLPFGCLSWAHDGSASLKVRSGTIRQVCANTVSASEAEGKRLGTDFTFRHTKNVQERIADARAAIQGVRDGLQVYREVMEDLAVMPVSTEQRDLFVSTIIGDLPDRDGVPVSMRPDTTARVLSNIETERAKVGALFMGPTIPEAHRLTAYGLFQAGTEYFDHLRNFRSQDSYVKRTLLSENPAKANLTRTIRELVATPV